MKEETTEEARIELLAERIKSLFIFVHSLNEDRDLLERVVKESTEKAQFAMSAAPIFGAFGEDYQEKEIEFKLYAKRARAILNLLEVLEQTDHERAEYHKKQASIRDARTQFMNIFG